MIDTGVALHHDGAVTETAASAPPRTPRRRRWLLLAVAIPVVLAGLAVEVRAVLWFHSVLPWSVGERVHVCGRDFQRAGHVSAAAVAGPLARIADGPLFQPLYGHPAGAPCTMEFYLPEGDGYRAYSLVGAP